MNLAESRNPNHRQSSRPPVDRYPAGAICLSDCDTARRGAGSVGDLLSSHIAMVGYSGAARFWNCYGLIPVQAFPRLSSDTDHQNTHAPKAVRLGLVPSVLITDGPYRFTQNPMYVTELASWLGSGTVLWKPGRFSGVPRTAASCESRTSARKNGLSKQHSIRPISSTRLLTLPRRWERAKVVRPPTKSTKTFSHGGPFLLLLKVVMVVFHAASLRPSSIAEAFDLRQRMGRSLWRSGDFHAPLVRSRNARPSNVSLYWPSGTSS